MSTDIQPCTAKMSILTKAGVYYCDLIVCVSILYQKNKCWYLENVWHFMASFN